MSVGLIECESCHRHHRASDPQCPFCQKATSPAVRLLNVVGGAVTTVILAACYGGGDYKDSYTFDSVPTTGDTGDTSDTGTTTTTTPVETGETGTETGDTGTETGDTGTETGDTGTTTETGGTGGSGT